MGLFALALKDRTIFGNRTTWVDTHSRPIEPAITFETNQTVIAQFAASLQEVGGAISPVCDDDHPTVAKKRMEGSQLFNGYFDRSLFGRDAPYIQRRDPTTWG